MNKEYYVVGFESNDPWRHPVDIYESENDGILKTADTFEFAPTFEEDTAEFLREYLQANYPDITWYLMLKNHKP